MSTTALTPAHRLIDPAKLTVGGVWGRRLADGCANFQLRLHDDSLLNCFRRRGTGGRFEGEHIGKFLLGAMAVDDLLHHPELAAKIQRVAEELPSLQEADGYLGSYLAADRWKPGKLADSALTWDVWVHKYCILMLLGYHARTGWVPALDAARRAADLLIREFGPGGRDLNRSDEHEGLASGSVLEPIMRLYQRTGEPRYLEFARHIVAGWEKPDGPRILPVLRARGPVHRIGRGKAYEMMSCFVGLIEFARSTGETDYLDLLLDARDRIADELRSPTGGMSKDEWFQPPGFLAERANVETCVTFTWMQFNLRLFELTGDERSLDLAEEAALNQLLPALSPQGDTWIYHLPTTGPKAFARRPGTDEPLLTCCSTNGERGLALWPAHAFTVTPAGELAVNFYIESRAAVELPGVGPVEIAQMTEFPKSGTVTVRAKAARAASFDLLLRRPAWCRTLRVNGEERTDRRVRVRVSGEVTVEVELDMRPRLLLCGHDARGKCAIAAGPLVLALDEAPAGLALDQVALRLDSERFDRSFTPHREEGWPVLDVPAAGVPAGAVSDATDAKFAAAGAARLRPIMLVGLRGNPSVTQPFTWQQVGWWGHPRQVELPEYRTLLPYFWDPVPGRTS